MHQSLFLQILEEGKRHLLQLATPDALARVYRTALHEQAEHYWDIYFNKQNHSSIKKLLENLFQNDDAHSCSFIQVVFIFSSNQVVT